MKKETRDEMFHSVDDLDKLQGFLFVEDMKLLEKAIICQDYKLAYAVLCYLKEHFYELGKCVLSVNDFWDEFRVLGVTYE